MKSTPKKPNNGQVNFDDMINDLIKNFLENMLKSELTEFLNYDKYATTGKNTGNSRNVNYSRNFQTKYGIIEKLEVPKIEIMTFRLLFLSHINVVMTGWNRL